MNNILLVGKICKIKKDKIMVAINRETENDIGLYETDFFNIEIVNNFKNIFEYIKIGDLIGIKGHLQNKELSGKQKNGTIVIIPSEITLMKKNN